MNDPSELQETSAAMNVLVAIRNNSAVWAAKASGWLFTNTDGFCCPRDLRLPESPMGMVSHLACVYLETLSQNR